MYCLIDQTFDISRDAVVASTGCLEDMSTASAGLIAVGFLRGVVGGAGFNEGGGGALA